MTIKGESSLPHVGVLVRLGVSEIHGIGAFAQQPIATGTNVFANDQREILWVPEAAVDDSCVEPWQRILYEDFAIRRGGEFGCPANFNLLTVGWYVNEPPAGVQCNLMATETFDLVAIRDIEAGEELTLDYSSFGPRAR